MDEFTETGLVILRKGKVVKEEDDTQTWFDTPEELKQYLECIEPLKDDMEVFFCERKWDFVAKPVITE